MEVNEIAVLEAIQSRDYVSQREISESANLSLGMVNVLLKKFLKKGLVKMERLDGRKIKYMLTPAGIGHLSRMTARYVAVSYKAVMAVRERLARKVQQHYGRDEVVYVLGGQDEIHAILADVLRELGMAHERIDRPEPGMKYVYWDPALAEEMAGDGEGLALL